MSKETNALDYRYVKRAIYDRYTDRLESKLQRMKADIRELEATVQSNVTALEQITRRAALFVVPKEPGLESMD